jgi:acetyl-CoA carboxylase biotin carboxyl carrier protein
LDSKQVRELVELMIEKDVAELEIEQHGVRLRLRRPEQVVAAAAPATMAAAPAPAASIPPPTSAASTAPVEVTHAGAHVISSPMVGTFYSAPDPDSEPFVQVGDRVEEGQTLCIIEAMKLMNEITADVAGEVVAVLQENAQPVEYGQELFAIRTG